MIIFFLFRSRDATDNLAKSLKDYADDETVTPTTSNALTSIAQAVTLLADFKDVHADRLSSVILHELVQWDGICRSARDELRTLAAIMEKEQSRVKHLESLKQRCNLVRFSLKYILELLKTDDFLEFH